MDTFQIIILFIFTIKLKYVAKLKIKFYEIIKQGPRSTPLEISPRNQNLAQKIFKYKLLYNIKFIFVDLDVKKFKN